MEIQPLKLILLLTNFSTLIFLVILMVDHYRAKNDSTSWGAIFHMFSFLWLSLRGMFWFLTIVSSTPWGAWTFYVLYWLPTPLEFGALMLLPFYFAQVIYSDGWKWHWGRWVQIAYTCFMLGLIILQAVWAVVEAIQKSQEETDFQTEFKNGIFRIATAACFLLLTMSQSVYGVQLLYLDKQRYDRFFITSRETMAAVNVVLILSFFSRGVYQLLALAHLYTMPVINLMGTADVPLTTFILHEFWNYVPFYLIVISITSRSFGSLGETKALSHVYYQAATDEDDSSDIEDSLIDMHKFSTPSHSPVLRLPRVTTEVKTPNSKRKSSYERPHSLSSAPHIYTWLSDSDPQSYCLATATADKKVADLMLAATQNLPVDSRIADRSASGTTSGVSSKDSFDFDETSILQIQRVKWLAHYYDTHARQKRRSGSEGSLYGGLSGLELSRLHLFMNESNMKSKGDFGTYSRTEKTAQSKPPSGRETHLSNSIATSNHKQAASPGDSVAKGGLPIGNHSDVRMSSGNSTTHSTMTQSTQLEAGQHASNLLSKSLLRPKSAVNYRGDTKHHTSTTTTSMSKPLDTNRSDASASPPRFVCKQTSSNDSQPIIAEGKMPEKYSVIDDERARLCYSQRPNQTHPSTIFTEPPPSSVFFSPNNMNVIPTTTTTLPAQVTNPRPTRPSPQLPFGFNSTIGAPDGVVERRASTTTPTVVVDAKGFRTPSRSDSAQSSNSDKSDGNNTSIAHARRTPDIKTREKKLLSRRDSEAFI